MMKKQLKFCLPLESKLLLIAGVDEVGRGPLAGDVVAAAVILDPQHAIHGLQDSKKISQKKREILFEEIQSCAISFGIARASSIEIDSINILQASLLAMKRAVASLEVDPEFVYVDGNRCPLWSVASKAVIKGDGIIQSIAAASILAKVTRDREMVAIESLYPGYGFEQHKGYPTKVHLEALEKLGPTPIHRKSFRPVAKLL